MKSKLKNALILLIFLIGMIVIFRDVTDLWNQRDLKTIQVKAAYEILEVSHSIDYLIPTGKSHYYLALTEEGDEVAGYVVRASQKWAEQNFEGNYLAKSEDGVTVTALSKEIDGKYKYLINDKIKEMTSALEGSGITLKLPIGKTNYLETGYRWKAIFKLVTLLLIVLETIIGILLVKRVKGAKNWFMTVYLVAVILTVILFIASILITR